MDSEEFASGYLGLLKAVGKITQYVRKSEVKKALSSCKLAITMAEPEKNLPELATGLFQVISGLPEWSGQIISTRLT